MNELTKVIHPFGPIFDKDSKILILGSLPSQKSREDGFYYGHPKNRFWKLLALLTNSKTPLDILQKTNLLQRNHVALWDVVKSCEIFASKDESIINAEPNDIAGLLERTKIEKIFANGRKAYEIYEKLIFQKTKIESVYLPSTSPANASYSLERLEETWGVALEKFL